MALAAAEELAEADAGVGAGTGGGAGARIGGGGGQGASAMGLKVLSCVFLMLSLGFCHDGFRILYTGWFKKKRQHALLINIWSKRKRMTYL